MDTEDDLRSVLAHAAGGPPMRLEATDVIARGSRIRRLRKRWAVGGSSVATALVLAVAGFAAGHRGVEPTPVQPARPELSTVATTTPRPLDPAPAAEPTTEAGVPATSRRAPAVPSASDRPRQTTTQAPRPPSATMRTAPPTATTAR